MFILIIHEKMQKLTDAFACTSLSVYETRDDCDIILIGMKKIHMDIFKKKIYTIQMTIFDFCQELQLDILEIFKYLKL